MKTHNLHFAHASNQIIKCPECDNVKLVIDDETGEVICEECGFVVTSTSINFQPEWSFFPGQPNKNLARTGLPTNLMIHDKGLSTIIDLSDIDSTGKKIKSNQKHKFYRLRKLHFRTRFSESNQRNLASALNNIVIIGDNLNLPKNVMETASIIYRKIIKKVDLRGRKTGCLAASAVYTACRICNVIRTLEEIADNSGYTKKEVARTYRYMFEIIESDVPLFSNRVYISKHINQLELHGETEIVALNLLSKASDLHLTLGRSQRGITASCVYIACLITGQKRTQAEIAKVAHVSEVTIRNRYKELTQLLDFHVRV